MIIAILYYYCRFLGQYDDLTTREVIIVLQGLLNLRNDRSKKVIKSNNDITMRFSGGLMQTYIKLSVIKQILI